MIEDDRRNQGQEPVPDLAGESLASSLNADLHTPQTSPASQLSTLKHLAPKSAPADESERLMHTPYNLTDGGIWLGRSLISGVFTTAGCMATYHLITTGQYLPALGLALATGGGIWLTVGMAKAAWLSARGKGGGII